MKLGSGDFYVSGTFWAAVAGAVMVVLSTIAIVFVTIRIGRPKRRLLYWMPVVTPLLNAEQDMRQDLEVRRGGQLLSEPHVLGIGLFNQGRLDIPSTAFDAGKLLRLDVGAPIIEVLKSTTTPANRAIPGVQIDGSMLQIGPGLIGRRQTITFSLLVDGPSPVVTCPEPELIDVEIRHQDGNYDPIGHFLDTRAGRLTAAGGTTFLAFLIALWLGLSHELFASPPRIVSTTVSCSLNTSLRPGTKVDLTYKINSSDPLRVGLGAGIYDNQGNDHSTSFGDIANIEIAKGHSTKTRPVLIPPDLPPGRYELDAEIWPANKIGQNGTNDITASACGYLAVP